MKKNVAIGLIGGALLASVGGGVAYADPGDEVVFEDLAFKACVASKLNVPTDATITQTQMASMTGMMECKPAGIVDIAPIAYATNLTMLAFEENAISDLSPLTGLTTLEMLIIEGNAVTDVTPLAGLAELRTLSLFRNNISDVAPLASLMNLTMLELSTNKIVDPSPLNALTELADLDLNDNQIFDVSGLAGVAQTAEVDVQGQLLERADVYRGVPVENEVRGFDGKPVPLSGPVTCVDAACGSVMYPNAIPTTGTPFTQEATNAAGLVVKFNGGVDRASLEPRLDVDPTGETGTGEPGASILITDSAGAVVSGPFIVEVDGTWAATSAPTYAPGTYTVTQRISGVATNTATFSILANGGDDNGLPGSDGPTGDAGSESANGAATGTGSDSVDPAQASAADHSQALAVTGGELFVGGGIAGLMLAVAGWVLWTSRRKSDEV